MNTFKRFFQYAALHKVLLFSTFGLNIIFATVSSIVFLILRNITDQALSQNYQALMNSLIIFGLLVMISLLGNMLTQQIADIAIIQSTSQLKQDIFKHLHKLDFQFHSNKSSGKLISIFRRGEGAFIVFYDEVLIWAAKIFIDFAVISIVFSQIYPRLVYVTAVVFFINLGTIYFTVRYNIRKRKEFNEVEDDITSTVVDNMIAFDTVKYFAQEDYEQRRLSKKMQTWVQYFIKYVQTFRVIDIVNGGLANVGMILTISVAAYDLVNQTISTGEFVLALSFASTFYPKIVNLVYQFRETAKNFEDLKQYLAILDEKVHVIDGPKTIKDMEISTTEAPEIKFTNLTFGYDDGNLVLDGINLTIKPGESVAFVGHSGVGKTTLVKLLLRFYDTRQGKITINQTDIKDITKTDLRSLIAMVPQEASLFNNTIGYNLGYARAGEYTQDELDKAAKQAYLYDFIQELPNGYDTEIGERGIKLSGGQKQRLAIARAFLKDSQIIVFDEATSNLDSDSEQMVQKAFAELVKNKTTIIIAHRLSTIKQVDRIIVFDKGKIVEEGSHEELVNGDRGIYKHLWELQSTGNIS